MRAAFFAALAALAVFYLTTAAGAGVFMCNATSNVVYTAYGYKEDGQWISRGWRKFKPNECNLLVAGVPQNNNFYYYAHSESGGVKWKGKSKATHGYFCAHPTKKFYYINTTEKCDGYTFRPVDLDGSEQYTVTLIEKRDPKGAALKCRSEIADGRDAFAKCWMRNVATERQKEILNCWDKTGSYASFALCANKRNMTNKQIQIADCTSQYNKDRIVARFADCIANGNLSDENRRLMNCALEHDSTTDIATCAVVDGLSTSQRRIVSCVARNRSSYVSIGACLADFQLTNDQSRIVNCVTGNATSYTRMALCSAGDNLTPEQRVFAECAITTGGNPYAFAGCVGTQLTLNELQKCMSDGIGGSGCFGDNNEAVKFVQNAFKDITRGPGPSHDLLGKDGWAGQQLEDFRRDITEGPGSNHDIVGEDGWVCETFLGGC